MKPIKIEEWGTFPIGELFDIHPTKAYKLTNSSLMEEDGVNPVVVNSSFNNGIGGYTNQENTEKGGIITFSDTTSADAIFFQGTDFVGYPHVQGMYPIGKHKDKWSKYSLLFFVSVFRNRALGLNYDYVNKFTRESAKQISIKLPVDETGNPDFSYMESYMKNLELAVSSSLTDLQSAKKFSTCNQIDTCRWETFQISDVFPIIKKPYVYHTKHVVEDENGIPYVVRSKFNNGIKYYVKKPSGSINPARVISFGAENATFFYQKEEWVSGRDIYYIDTQHLTEYACLFITACLQPIASKYSYNFGLFPELLKKEKIKLPVNSEGEPDYLYMEEYMNNIFQKTRYTFNKMAECI